MSSLECSICLYSLPAYSQIADYKADKAVKVLACKHIFHRACLEEWFAAQDRKNHLHTCPNCRLVIVKKNQNQGCPSLDEIVSHLFREVVGWIRIPTLLSCFSGNQLPDPSMGSAMQEPRQYSFSSMEPDYENAYSEGLRIRI